MYNDALYIILEGMKLLLHNASVHIYAYVIATYEPMSRKQHMTQAREECLHIAIHNVMALGWYPISYNMVLYIYSHGPKCNQVTIPYIAKPNIDIHGNDYILLFSYWIRFAHHDKQVSTLLSSPFQQWLSWKKQSTKMAIYCRSPSYAIWDSFQRSIEIGKYMFKHKQCSISCQPRN